MHSSSVSPRLASLWGLEPDTIESNPDRILHRVHPEDRDVAASLALPQPGSTARASFRLATDDGVCIWVDVTAIQEKDTQQPTPAGVCFALDDFGTGYSSKL